MLQPFSWAGNMKIRRIAGALLILTCLTILIYDAASGRMSTFRRLYYVRDVNGALRDAVLSGDSGAWIVERPEG